MTHGLQSDAIINKTCLRHNIWNFNSIYVLIRYCNFFFADGVREKCCYWLRFRVGLFLRYRWVSYSHRPRDVLWKKTRPLICWKRLWRPKCTSGTCLRWRISLNTTKTLTTLKFRTCPRPWYAELVACDRGLRPVDLHWTWSSPPTTTRNSTTTWLCLFTVTSCTR